MIVLCYTALQVRTQTAVCDFLFIMLVAMDIPVYWSKLVDKIGAIN